MSEEMNQHDSFAANQASPVTTSAPTSPWESQLQQRANDLLRQRLSPLQAEIARLQTSVAELSARLNEQAEAPHTEAETGGLIEYVRSWFSDSTAKAEADFNARLEAARADWHSESERGEKEFQQRLENAVAEATAMARRESAAQMEDLREQLEASRKALTLSLASAQTSSFDQLKAAVEDLDAQRTQADTLSALVRGAANLAPRVAFFVVKGGDCVGWKAAGFDNGLNDETIKSLTVAGTAQTMLQDALANFRTAVINSSSPADNSAVLGSYGSPAPERAVAVPLVIRGKAAAVLYADSGTQSDNSINTSGLETLVQVAAMGIELLPARRGLEPLVRPSSPVAQPSSAPTVASVPEVAAAITDAPSPEAETATQNDLDSAASARTTFDGPEIAPAETTDDSPPEVALAEEAAATAATEDLTGKAPSEPATVAAANLADVDTQEMEPVAVASEATPDLAIPDAAPPAAEPPTVASLAEEAPMDKLTTTPDPNSVAAESDIESATNYAPPFVPSAPGFAGFDDQRFQAAPTPVVEPARETERAQPIPAPPSVPTPGSESEQRAHNDARRFARLLVSEIKLYNAAKVNDGRRSFDLYDRLKDEIDRSRKVYDKRVSPTVANLYDYFYDELVQTLAEGEQAKLGDNCPGPVVIAQQ